MFMEAFLKIRDEKILFDFALDFKIVKCKLKI